MEKTTIQIFVKTKDKLRSLGERNEDYDSIINRAIVGEFASTKQKTKEVTSWMQKATDPNVEFSTYCNKQELEVICKAAAYVPHPKCYYCGPRTDTAWCCDHCREHFREIAMTLRRIWNRWTAATILSLLAEQRKQRKGFGLITKSPLQSLNAVNAEYPPVGRYPIE